MALRPAGTGFAGAAALATVVSLGAGFVAAGLAADLVAGAAARFELAAALVLVRRALDDIYLSTGWM
ncbi:MAG: hypothetical protein EPO08_18390 [Rhodospirillaceae bacterium]|nr:MAG: hypothetical protein EPO08_18390 [Rhodospirillaceae bacterium]